MFAQLTNRQIDRQTDKHHYYGKGNLDRSQKQEFAYRGEEHSAPDKLMVATLIGFIRQVDILTDFPKCTTLETKVVRILGVTSYSRLDC